jgi:nitrogen regulatory protein PII
MLASADRADEVIETVSRAARTTLVGDDGAILIYEVTDAVRIRTRQRLEFVVA